MHGVLSIYIFKRYQSSEILIKDKDHLRQGRESTDIPALLCSPSPIPLHIETHHKNSAQKKSNNCDAPRNRGNTLIFHQKYLRGNWLFWRLGKTSITTLGKRASCKLPLSSYTNERMERRIFFHNSWTINMHMFKILLPELLLKIDAFYL